MKRFLVVVVALLAMVAFASGVLAQPPAKTEKPAVAPAKIEKKAKEAKPMKFSGAVAAYEAGKMIKVKGAKDKEMTFDIAMDAKMKGEVKEGTKVTIMYKKDGDKMVATSISVTPPAKKKEAPKKEVKEEKKKM